MSEIKHTLGPWTFDDETTTPDFVYDADGNVVADTFFAGGLNDGVANAKLIAAAPDLLAVLIELTDIEGPLPGDRTWHAKALAAIAKATGAA